MLTNKAEALVRADSATPAVVTPDDKLDRLLTGLGNLTIRMDADDKKKEDLSTRFDSLDQKLDAMGKRLDSVEGDKARKDSEEKEKEEKDEKARKDAEEKEEEKKRADAAEAEKEKERADAAARGAEPGLAAQLKALEARIPVALSDADRAQFVGAQVKAERVAQAFGDSDGAPRWLNGESLPDYQRRLLSKYKAHSIAWKDKDLARVDASVLDVAEAQIYADSVAAASAPTSVVAGTLREVVTQDATGRRTIRFHGDPNVCWAPFKHTVRAVTGMGRNLNPTH